MTAPEQKKLKDTILNICADYATDLRLKYPRLVEDDILLLACKRLHLNQKRLLFAFSYSDTHPINQRKQRIKERMEENKIKV